MKYKLLTPFTSSFGEKTELELRPVQTVADVLATRRAATDPFEQSLHLVARLTGLDFEIELVKMDMRDIEALIGLIEKNNADPRKEAATDPKALPSV